MIMTEVLIELADGVAVLTVDRPSVRNAISPATMDALDAGLDAVAAADVLVIRGGGNRAFIAASPSRPIKSVIAAAAPHHHPGLETPAAAFASLWVADAHWAAADGLARKS
jgi:enoyl-CoA hydratase/carnithine racemase